MAIRKLKILKINYPIYFLIEIFPIYNIYFYTAVVCMRTLELAVINNGVFNIGDFDFKSPN